MIIEKQLKILEQLLDKYINSNISTKDVIIIIYNNLKIKNALKTIVSECSIEKEVNKMIYLDTLDRIKSNKIKRFLNAYIFLNNYKFVEEQEEELEELEELDNIIKDEDSTLSEDIDKKFFRELKKQPTLSEEETIKLIKKYQDTGDVKYKNQVVSGHLRLVLYIAKRYIGRGEFLDLIQEGSIGLGKAVEKFNLNRGCKLSTYSTWWIRQSITRYLDEKVDTIKKPCHVIQNIKKVNYAISKYQSEHSGIEPSLEELSFLTGFDVENIKMLKESNLSSISLNKEVGNESDGEANELMDFMSDEKSEKDIYKNAENDDLKRKIDEVFDVVFPIDNNSKRETNIKIRTVLTHRFGLYGESPKTLEEVAPLLHVTRERVRQIEAKGLQRLRRNKETKSLKLFLDE